MTTAPNSEASLPEAAGEPAHNDLVAKLVAEAFSGLARGARPSAPSVPAEIPGLAKLPDFSAAEASSGVPPVHSTAQPAAPKLAEPQTTSSGGHAPDSGGTYAFGEPRCNDAYRPQGNRPETKTKNENPLLGLGDSEPATPEYYFLQGGNPSGKTPASCQSYPKNATPVPKFDIEGVRRDFPALHQIVNGKPLIWLDNAATTHKPQAVIDATSQFYGRDNSNIHRAAHALAARSTELFEAGREKVRKFLGAGDAKEIIFVRGTTEGINLVAQSYGRKNIGAGDEIIVSELEHHANIVPWKLLAEQVGAVIRVIPINDRGELILEEYVKLLGPKTKFVSVAHVSNSLGTINPVEQIIALAHAHGAPVLIDGAQSTPHMPVNVTGLDADFYVFSGHKIFAPTGIGALYGKAPLLEAMPPWQGGGHMIKDVRFEKTVYQNAPEKFEAGTPDIAGVVGLGAAIDYLFKVGIPAIATYEHALLEYAQQALSTIPGLRPIGTATAKASVLSFVIPGVPNENIARHLDKNGIAVRAGHHCAQPAIRHFGLESSVRPSLAFYNTREEVDTLVRTLRSLKRN
ncbi:MAG TPA: SufS family cysteine desulfurase [Verrucomicrobiae bacterium]|nr:SufS family cysteine desulfurase [Verrucomicrobiae bacterium]